MRGWPLWLSLPLAGGLLLLLGYVSFARPRLRQSSWLPASAELSFEAPTYQRILVTLDHSKLDGIALGHAVALARSHQASLHLLHVEEGVTSQLFGELAETSHVTEGRQYLEQLLAAVRGHGLAAELAIVHNQSPRKAIVGYVRQLAPDLIVMGAHGHTGLGDLVMGTTIEAVRHGVAVPVLVVHRPTQN
jgi:manganese transport protein